MVTHVPAEEYGDERGALLSFLEEQRGGIRRTVLGLNIYSVGGNPEAARLAGIKVWAVLLFVYCASGLLSGLGGVMASARLYAANGLQLGASYELDAIAAVILGGTSFVGGTGSILGTLIGALIIAVLVMLYSGRVGNWFARRTPGDPLRPAAVPGMTPPTHQQF